MVVAVAQIGVEEMEAEVASVEVVEAVTQVSVEVAEAGILATVVVEAGVETFVVVVAAEEETFAVVVETSEVEGAATEVSTAAEVEEVVEVAALGNRAGTWAFLPFLVYSPLPSNLISPTAYLPRTSRRLWTRV